MELVVEKVTEKLTQSLAAVNPSAHPPDFFQSLQDGLTHANEIMQTMCNHQVMSMAPSPVRESYLREVFDTIALQATNKKMKIMLENEELLLWK